MSKKEEIHDLRPAKITSVYINKGSGGYRIRVKFKNKNLYYILGKDGDPYVEKLYDTAVLAKMTNQKVWVRYFGKKASEKYVPRIATLELL